MKNIKRLLMVILAIVMTLTTVFTMSACDSLMGGDGNGKNNTSDPEFPEQGWGEEIEIKPGENGYGGAGKIKIIFKATYAGETDAATVTVKASSATVEAFVRDFLRGPLGGMAFDALLEYGVWELNGNVLSVKDNSITLRHGDVLHLKLHTLPDDMNGGQPAPDVPDSNVNFDNPEQVWGEDVTVTPGQNGYGEAGSVNVGFKTSYQGQGGEAVIVVGAASVTLEALIRDYLDGALGGMNYTEILEYGSWYVNGELLKEDGYTRVLGERDVVLLVMRTLPGGDDGPDVPANDYVLIEILTSDGPEMHRHYITTEDGTEKIASIMQGMIFTLEQLLSKGGRFTVNGEEIRSDNVAVRNGDHIVINVVGTEYDTDEDSGKPNPDTPKDKITVYVEGIGGNGEIESASVEVSEGTVLKEFLENVFGASLEDLLELGTVKLNGVAVSDDRVVLKNGDVVGFYQSGDVGGGDEDDEWMIVYLETVGVNGNIERESVQIRKGATLDEFLQACFRKSYAELIEIGSVEINGSHVIDPDVLLSEGAVVVFVYYGLPPVEDMINIYCGIRFSDGAEEGEPFSVLAGTTLAELIDDYFAGVEDFLGAGVFTVNGEEVDGSYILAEGDCVIFTVSGTAEMIEIYFGMQLPDGTVEGDYLPLVKGMTLGGFKDAFFSEIAGMLGDGILTVNGVAVDDSYVLADGDRVIFVMHSGDVGGGDDDEDMIEIELVIRMPDGTESSQRGEIEKGMTLKAFADENLDGYDVLLEMGTLTVNGKPVGADYVLRDGDVLVIALKDDVGGGDDDDEMIAIEFVISMSGMENAEKGEIPKGMTLKAFADEFLDGYDVLLEMGTLTVNGKPVGADYVLQEGDRVVFEVNGGAQPPHDHDWNSETGTCRDCGTPCPEDHANLQDACHVCGYSNAAIGKEFRTIDIYLNGAFYTSVTVSYEPGKFPSLDDALGLTDLGMFADLKDAYIITTNERDFEFGNGRNPLYYDTEIYINERPPVIPQYYVYYAKYYNGDNWQNSVKSIGWSFDEGTTIEEALQYFGADIWDGDRIYVNGALVTDWQSVQITSDTYVVVLEGSIENHSVTATVIDERTGKTGYRTYNAPVYFEMVRDALLGTLEDGYIYSLTVDGNQYGEGIMDTPIAMNFTVRIYQRTVNVAIKVVDENGKLSVMEKDFKGNPPTIGDFIENYLGGNPENYYFASVNGGELCELTVDDLVPEYWGYIIHRSQIKSEITVTYDLWSISEGRVTGSITVASPVILYRIFEGTEFESFANNIFWNGWSYTITVDGVALTEEDKGGSFFLVWSDIELIARPSYSVCVEFYDFEGEIPMPDVLRVSDLQMTVREALELMGLNLSMFYTDEINLDATLSDLDMYGNGEIIIRLRPKTINFELSIQHPYGTEERYLGGFIGSVTLGDLKSRFFSEWGMYPDEYLWMYKSANGELVRLTDDYTWNGDNTNGGLITLLLMPADVSVRVNVMDANGNCIFNTESVAEYGITVKEFLVTCGFEVDPERIAWISSEYGGLTLDSVIERSMYIDVMLMEDKVESEEVTVYLDESLWLDGTVGVGSMTIPKGTSVRAFFEEYFKISFKEMTLYGTVTVNDKPVKNGDRVILENDDTLGYIPNGNVEPEKETITVYFDNEGKHHKPYEIEVGTMLPAFVNQVPGMSYEGYLKAGYFTVNGVAYVNADGYILQHKDVVGFVPNGQTPTIPGEGMIIVYLEENRYGEIVHVPFEVKNGATLADFLRMNGASYEDLLANGRYVTVENAFVSADYVFANKDVVRLVEGAPDIEKVITVFYETDEDGVLRRIPVTIKEGMTFVAFIEFYLNDSYHSITAYYSFTLNDCWLEDPYGYILMDGDCVRIHPHGQGGDTEKMITVYMEIIENGNVIYVPYEVIDGMSLADFINKYAEGMSYEYFMQSGHFTVNDKPIKDGYTYFLQSGDQIAFVEKSGGGDAGDVEDETVTVYYQTDEDGVLRETPVSIKQGMTLVAFIEFYLKDSYEVIAKQYRFTVNGWDVEDPYTYALAGGDYVRIHPYKTDEELETVITVYMEIIENGKVVYVPYETTNGTSLAAFVNKFAENMGYEYFMQIGYFTVNGMPVYDGYNYFFSEGDQIAFVENSGGGDAGDVEEEILIVYMVMEGADGKPTFEPVSIKRGMTLAEFVNVNTEEGMGYEFFMQRGHFTVNDKPIKDGYSYVLQAGDMIAFVDGYADGKEITVYMVNTDENGNVVSLDPAPAKDGMTLASFINDLMAGNGMSYADFVENGYFTVNGKPVYDGYSYRLQDGDQIAFLEKSGGGDAGDVEGDTITVILEAFDEYGKPCQKEYYTKRGMSLAGFINSNAEFGSYDTSIPYGYFTVNDKPVKDGYQYILQEYDRIAFVSYGQGGESEKMVNVFVEVINEFGNLVSIPVPVPYNTTLSMFLESNMGMSYQQAILMGTLSVNGNMMPDEYYILQDGDRITYVPYGQGGDVTEPEQPRSVCIGFEGPLYYVSVKTTLEQFIRDYVGDPYEAGVVWYVDGIRVDDPANYYFYQTDEVVVVSRLYEYVEIKGFSVWYDGNEYWIASPVSLGDCVSLYLGLDYSYVQSVWYVDGVCVTLDYWLDSSCTLTCDYMGGGMMGFDVYFENTNCSYYVAGPTSLYDFIWNQLSGEYDPDGKMGMWFVNGEAVPSTYDYMITGYCNLRYENGEVEVIPTFEVWFMGMCYTEQFPLSIDEFLRKYDILPAPEGFVRTWFVDGREVPLDYMLFCNCNLFYDEKSAECNHAWDSWTGTCYDCNAPCPQFDSHTDLNPGEFCPTCGYEFMGGKYYLINVLFANTKETTQLTVTDGNECFNGVAKMLGVEPTHYVWSTGWNTYVDDLWQTLDDHYGWYDEVDLTLHEKRVAVDVNIYDEYGEEHYTSSDELRFFYSVTFGEILDRLGVTDVDMYIWTLEGFDSSGEYFSYELSGDRSMTLTCLNGGWDNGQYVQFYSILAKHKYFNVTFEAYGAQSDKLLSTGDKIFERAMTVREAIKLFGYDCDICTRIDVEYIYDTVDPDNDVIERRTHIKIFVDEEKLGGFRPIY